MKTNSFPAGFFVLIILFMSAAVTSAQEGKGQSELTQLSNRNTPLVISRINGTVTLDGISDEAAWEGIEPLPVVMQSPVFGDEPSERTEILIAYDDEYLYAAGRFYESDPSKIHSTSMKRDDIKPSCDWFGLVIDTFNDNENALSFFVAPSGLRSDFTIFNDADGSSPMNLSWNTFWDAETVRNDDGWFAEIRIPFSNLKFQEKDGRVIMGLITWRYIARIPEIDIFPAFPSNWGYWSPFKPSQAQKISFEGLSRRKPLYITPYFLGGIQKTNELNDEETAYIHKDDPDAEAGLDVKYGLTSNVTLDVTINTDFAQIEADDQQVNLTRYSLFFPEKRLFFQERSSNFEFNLDEDDRLFHSRRLGLHEKGSVRIYGGARMVGRIGPWDVGFLNMKTEQYEELPSENFGVLRLRRQVINPYTYIGGILTSRIGDNGTYNTVYGFDGIFRLFKDDYLTLNFAQSFENDNENNPLSPDPSLIRLNWQRRTIKGWGYDLDFSRSGEDFEPGVGYERRDDFTRFGNKILYGWLPGKQSLLFDHNIFVEGEMFLHNSDSSTESSEIGPGWKMRAKSGYDGEISFKRYYENVSESFELSDDTEVPIGEYTFYGIEGDFGTPEGRLYRIRTTFDAGSFYDGRRMSLSLSPRGYISRMEITGTYKFNHITFPERNQKFIAHICQLRAQAMLTVRHSITAFIQYNSADDIVVSNIRYRYNQREGNDLYIVYNNGLNTDRQDYNPVRPAYSNHTIMLKYSYTFKL